MDSSIAPKRKRGPNFSAEEKNLLHVLIDKHKTILESKRHNYDVIRGKKRAWEEICIEFNDSLPSGFFRNVDALKFAHENEKRKTRLQLTESLQLANDSTDDPEVILFQGLNSPQIRKFEPHLENEIDSDEEKLVIEETCIADGDEKLSNNEKLDRLKMELLEQQIRTAKAEAEAKNKIYQLKIRNLELDIRLKERQLQ